MAAQLMPRVPFLRSGYQALLAIGLLGAGASASSAQTPPAAPVLDRLTIVAPAAPGGGWDQLARAMQRELERSGVVPSVQVENVPGAAGTIGLAQFIGTRRADGRALLVNGLVMLGAILWNDSPVSIAQSTPIARVTGEYEIVAVPAASPHTSMQSLVQALRANPAAVSWAGGSAGGTDHILAGLIVGAAGLDPRRTNYIAFSGGGEAVTALLGGQVTAGISGYSEFEAHIASGQLRAIAISAPARRPALPDIPTLVEQQLDVVLENWRAVVAPPGLSDADRQRLTSVVERMTQSATWRETLQRVGWTDSFLAGPAFEEFLTTERTRMARIVMRLRTAPGADTGEWVFPVLVTSGALASLVILLFQRRPGHGTPRGPGERLASGDPGMDWRAVARLLAGLVIFAAFVETLGFVASGSVLFACTASAFGSGRWFRNTVAGLLLCGAVYLTFTKGLDVPLPAGAVLSWRP